MLLGQDAMGIHAASTLSSAQILKTPNFLMMRPDLSDRQFGLPQMGV